MYQQTRCMLNQCSLTGEQVPFQPSRKKWLLNCINKCDFHLDFVHQNWRFCFDHAASDTSKWPEHRIKSIMKYLLLTNLSLLLDDWYLSKNLLCILNWTTLQFFWTSIIFFIYQNVPSINFLSGSKSCVFSLTRTASS